MVARDDGCEGGRRVNEIRRGDDDRLYVVALHDVLLIWRSDVDAGLLAGALQRGGIAVAERDDLRVRTHRESGQMILQCDAAAADDGEVKIWHALFQEG